MRKKDVSLIKHRVWDMIKRPKERVLKMRWVLS
jgi:hypothetical protein